MNLTEALVFADRMRDPANTFGLQHWPELADALDVLAGWVRQHLPPMPHAQRGRTVDHAVELAQSPMGAALVPLCGGLTVEWGNEPIDIEALPTFDPAAADACQTCTRRLPPALRPPMPTRPPRTRQTDPLDNFELWPGVHDGEYGIELVAMADTPPVTTVVELFGVAPSLAEVVASARRHGGKVRP